MSLVECPECTKEVSEKAKQCIQCGYPIEDEKGAVYYGTGLKYFNEITEFNQEKLDLAFYWWRKAAENNDYRGLVRMYWGTREFTCQFPSKTYDEHREFIDKWIKIGVDSGNHECKYLIIDTLSPENALDTLENLSKKGNKNAMGLLATGYSHGSCGITIDIKKATALHLELAEDGNPVSQLFLAESYYRGTEVIALDEKKAFYWGEKIHSNKNDTYGYCFADYQEMVNNNKDR